VGGLYVIRTGQIGNCAGQLQGPMIGPGTHTCAELKARCRCGCS
jgi:hypothetical protein